MSERAPATVRSRRRAGLAAIVAAGAWLAWCVLNLLTRGALDGPRTGANALWGWLGTGLLVAAALLVIPAALALRRALRPSAPLVVTWSTAAGVLSLVLWALAALARWWPAGLEPTFLALSACWWLGTGPPLRRVRYRLGTLTVVLGVAAAADAVVTAGEGSLPAWTVPVFGAWKLPLQLIWTVCVGVVLRREDMNPAGPHSETIAESR